MKRDVVTAQDIIRGALSAKRPKVRFPGLSADLNSQASARPVTVRKNASPFVRNLVERMRRP